MIKVNLSYNRPLAWRLWWPHCWRWPQIPSLHGSLLFGGLELSIGSNASVQVLVGLCWATALVLQAPNCCHPEIKPQIEFSSNSNNLEWFETFLWLFWILLLWLDALSWVQEVWLHNNRVSFFQVFTFKTLLHKFCQCLSVVFVKPLKPFPE